MPDAGSISVDYSRACCWKYFVLKTSV